MASYCVKCSCNYVSTEDEHQKTTTHMKFMQLYYKIEKLENECIILRLKKTMQYLQELEDEIKANMNLLTEHLEYLRDKTK